jgi:CRP/FNR family transcriptional regulator
VFIARSCKKLIGDKLEAVSTCIGNLWIFENLNAEEKQALAEASVKKSHRQGKVIFLQGFRATTLTFCKITLFSRNDVAQKEGDCHGLR